MQRVKSLGFIKNAAIIISSSFKLPYLIVNPQDSGTYLRELFIFIPNLIELVLDFVLQLNQELPLHLTYSYLAEFIHS